jgi:hypothetical protein
MEARTHKKPLWKFTWRAWALVPVAIALLVVLLTGFDLQHQSLRLYHAIFGANATMNLVAFGMAPHMLDMMWTQSNFGHHFAPPGAHLSLVTAMLSMIALAVHPIRGKVWHHALLIAMGLLIPPIAFSGVSWLQYAVLHHPPKSHFLSSHEADEDAAHLLAAIACALLLWLITRSWRLSLVLALLLFIGALHEIEGMRNYQRHEPLLFAWDTAAPLGQVFLWAFNPLIFACVLFWAIRARLRVIPDHCCGACGYDLSATHARACPERGSTAHAPSPAVSKSAPAAS